MNIPQMRRLGFILVFVGFAIGIPGVWILLAHDHYEAVARLQLTGIPDFEKEFSQIDHPAKEFNQIKSEAILGKVVEKMELEKMWGQKYAEGHKLTHAEVMSIFDQVLSFRAIHNSRQFDMAFMNDDPVEATNVVNTLAAYYRDSSTNNEVTIVSFAEKPTTPINRKTPGKPFIYAGIAVIFIGVRFLWRAYFAAPIGNR